MAPPSAFTSSEMFKLIFADNIAKTPTGVHARRMRKSQLVVGSNQGGPQRRSVMERDLGSSCLLEARSSSSNPGCVHPSVQRAHNRSCSRCSWKGSGGAGGRGGCMENGRPGGQVTIGALSK